MSWRQPQDEVAWQRGFHRLRAFRDLYGHSRPDTEALARRAAQGDAEAQGWLQVARWLDEQRELAVSQRLPHSRARLLRKLSESR